MRFLGGLHHGAPIVQALAVHIIGGSGLGLEGGSATDIEKIRTLSARSIITT